MAMILIESLVNLPLTMLITVLHRRNLNVMGVDPGKNRGYITPKLDKFDLFLLFSASCWHFWVHNLLNVDSGPLVNMRDNGTGWPYDAWNMIAVRRKKERNEKKNKIHLWGCVCNWCKTGTFVWYTPANWGHAANRGYPGLINRQFPHVSDDFPTF